MVDCESATVLKEELAHGCGGESWSPPWTGDWVRPNGALQTLVVETLSPPTNACVCADALARFNAVHATSGAVRRRSEKNARGPPFSKRRTTQRFRLSL